MLIDVLSLLPGPVARCSPGFAAALAAVGLFLWSAGARFSQGAMTLIAVAVGTSVGLHLPAWYGWTIDGMGVGVAGALVFGASAFVLHRTWVGACLGTILAVWTGTAAWVGLSDGAAWRWPTVQWSQAGGFADAMSQVWRTLPGDLPRVMPFALASGFASGIIISLLWPRLSRVIVYSLLGTSLLVFMGTLAVRGFCPQWLSYVPPQTTSQAGIVLGLVLLGALIQWWLTSPPLEKVEKSAPSAPADATVHPIEPKRRQAARPAQALRPMRPSVVTAGPAEPED